MFRRCRGDVTDLLVLTSKWVGHLEILLAVAEAEDAGNLVGLRWEEVLSPAPDDTLRQEKRNAEVTTVSPRLAEEAPPPPPGHLRQHRPLFCSFNSSILKRDKEPDWLLRCGAPPSQQDATEWLRSWFWS